MVLLQLINDEEFNLFNRLIRISRMLEDLYSKLYNLELNNEKDSALYNKYLNYLLMVLDMEKESYLKLNLDQDKVYNYLIFINNTYHLDKDFTDLESIILSKYDKRIIRRIIAKLLDILPNKDAFLTYCLHDEIKDFIENNINKNNILDDDLEDNMSVISKTN